MEVNLFECNHAIEAIDNGINSIKQSYDTEWNDSVHDSFSNYISEANNALSGIKMAIEKITDLQVYLEAIDIDSVGEEVEGVSSAIESIVI